MLVRLCKEVNGKYMKLVFKNKTCPPHWHQNNSRQYFFKKTLGGKKSLAIFWLGFFFKKRYVMIVSVNTNLSHLVLNGTLSLRNTDIFTSGINLKVIFDSMDNWIYIHIERLNPVAIEFNVENICLGECLEVPFIKVILKVHGYGRGNGRHFLFF